MATLQNEEKVQHVAKDLLPEWMLPGRTRVLNAGGKDSTTGPKAVFYWMQRDVRSVDNWALFLAAHLAETKQVPLRVVYALPPPVPQTTEGIPDLVDLPMTERHGEFLLGGLECVHKELEEYKIPLDVVSAPSHAAVGESVCEVLLKQPCVVVTDLSPLRHHREWMEIQAKPLLEKADCPFYQVDAHNIVPVWIASFKREYAARTIRSKITNLYKQYLQKFPKLKDFQLQKQPATLPSFERQVYKDFMQMDASVGELEWAKPGTEAGLKQATFFFENGLKSFDKLRNNPNEKHIISRMSPWVNHGHVSFQRLALAVKKLNKYANGTAAFIEEGVVRRELSDNYVFYSPNNYDSLTAAADWAQDTLATHASDPREYVYMLQEFERGETHDDLWNAAQLQGVRDGKIHGFLRMYWAKKILEWTESPEIALKTALYLNDKFNVDGRDPNGFVGVGWSIMGIHDMGWKERDCFGKIRYMNYAGCKRKFKVADFVAKYKGASANALKSAKAHESSEEAKKRKSTPWTKATKKAKG